MTIVAERLAPRGLRLTLDQGRELLLRAKTLYALGPELDLCAAPRSRAPRSTLRLAQELERNFCLVKSLAPGASLDLFPESLGGALALPPQPEPLLLRLSALLALDDPAALAPATNAARALPGFVCATKAFLALGAWGEPWVATAEGTDVYAASTILAFEATLTPRRVCRRFAGPEAGIAFSGRGRVWLDSRSNAALRAVLAGTLPAMSSQEEE